MEVKRTTVETVEAKQGLMDRVSGAVSAARKEVTWKRTLGFTALNATAIGALYFFNRLNDSGDSDNSVK